MGRDSSGQAEVLRACPGAVRFFGLGGYIMAGLSNARIVFTKNAYAAVIKCPFVILFKIDCCETIISGDKPL